MLTELFSDLTLQSLLLFMEIIDSHIEKVIEIFFKGYNIFMLSFVNFINIMDQFNQSSQIRIETIPILTLCLLLPQTVSKMLQNPNSNNHNSGVVPTFCHHRRYTISQWYPVRTLNNRTSQAVRPSTDSIWKSNETAQMIIG